MSDAVQIELIRALASVPSALVALAGAWFAYRASSHSKDAAENSKRAELSSNGMSDKLVALASKSAHAEGVLEGEKNREEHHS